MTDVLDFYCPTAIQRRLERMLSEAPPVADLTRPSVVNESSSRMTPRDCVRQNAVVGDDTILLVGFDLEGRARIKIELPADEDPATWEQWIMRWLRRKYGRLSLVRDL